MLITNNTDHAKQSNATYNIAQNYNIYTSARLVKHQTVLLSCMCYIVLQLDKLQPGIDLVWNTPMHCN